MRLWISCHIVTAKGGWDHWKEYNLRDYNSKVPLLSVPGQKLPAWVTRL